MNDDTKQLAIGMFGVVAIVVCAIFGGLRCESQKKDFYGEVYSRWSRSA